MSSAKRSASGRFLSLSEDEVVTGRNNKHMDFRLSVLKVPDGDRTSVVVSTICTVHNCQYRSVFGANAPPIGLSKYEGLRFLEVAAKGAG